MGGGAYILLSQDIYFKCYCRKYASIAATNRTIFLHNRITVVNKTALTQNNELVFLQQLQNKFCKSVISLLQQISQQYCKKKNRIIGTNATIILQDEQ